MANHRTQDVPTKFRPSGDGRFLYRFRGRDHLLTREQVLRHIKLYRNWVCMLLALTAIAALVFLTVVNLGVTWRTVPMAGFLVLCLASLLGFYWRTAVLLDGCDYRVVPKATGMVARAVQWLEFNRSTYLGHNPPPLQLFFYCLASAGMFAYATSLLWPSPAEFAGLAFLVEMAFYLPVSALFLGYFAISFYAFWRAMAGNGPSASGPDRPPGS